MLVTEHLSEHAWMALVDAAKKHDVTLQCLTSPGIEMPGINETPSITLAQSDHTRLIYHDSPHLLNYPENAVVIDISELEASDLLGGIGGQYDKDRHNFSFNTIENKLANWLEDGERVVLKGEWTKEMSAALHPLLNKCLHNASALGHLYTIDDKASPKFTFLRHRIIPLRPKKQRRPYTIAPYLKNSFTSQKTY